MKRKIFCLILVLAVMLALAPGAYALTPQQEQARMDTIISLIQSSALDYRGEDVLRRGLAKLFEDYPNAYEALMDSILSSYDSHSMFIPAGGYDSAFPTDGANYVGVGITLRSGDDGIGAVISSVSDYGPAKGSGLMEGDMLVRVDNVNVLLSTPTNISYLLRGEEGTTVEITVTRGSSMMTFTLTRAQVREPNLDGRDMGGGVYYMKIGRFTGEDTPFRFNACLLEMKKTGSKALVLDLRGNPGGEVDMALRFIDQLIPEKGVKYFSLITRDEGTGTLAEDSISSGIGPALNKIIILTDSDTASAAEIVTSSLVELGYAEAVGETSYGKARGQIHAVFEDGSAAVITSVALVPPSGIDYEGIGLIPAHPVENVTVPHPAAGCRRLSPLRVGVGERDANAMALVDSLRALGFLDGEHPVVDSDTIAALNRFRDAVGVTNVGYLNAETANLINDALDDLSSRTVVEDRQMAAALELARGYAASGESGSSAENLQKIS